MFRWKANVMLDEYQRLLETLKENKFSRDVRFARQAILALLNSDRFSPALREYLTKMHGDGVPFTHFAHEPAQVSQIKKLINALYHAELALIGAEEANIFSVASLYMHTLHHTYQACYLATHFDIDLQQLFSQELALLTPLYTKFQAFAESQTEEARGYLLQIDSTDLARKVGEAGGNLTNQLGKPTGVVDFDFLAKFGVTLPDYLNKLSDYIKEFSSGVSKYEPANLDKKELDKLEDNALQLVNSLDKARMSGVFLPLKALHYIHIIRHTITLSMSIFTQAGHLNGAGQDLVRSQLDELKYKVLPALFGLADKIEEHAMLTPGVISGPLMLQASRLYQSLIFYTSKFVDFEKTGQSLVSVEDTQFVDLRLQHLYQRSADDFHELLNMREAENASYSFFKLLHDPLYKKLRIQQLPLAVKQQLATYYKLIQPYVLGLNVPLNNAIIAGLTDVPAPAVGWFSRSRDTDLIEHVLPLQSDLNASFSKIRASHKFHTKLNNDLIVSIASGVEDLKLFPYHPSNNPFEMNEATILGLDKAVAENKAFALEPQPYTALMAATIAAKAATITANDLLISRIESAGVAQGQLMRLDSLTSGDVLIMHQFYQIKCAKLKRAQEAYNEFHRIVRDDSHPPMFNTKKILRNLYGIFQPYYVSGRALIVGAERLEGAFDRESAIIAELSSDDGDLTDGIASIVAQDSQIKAVWASEKQRLEARRTTFNLLVKRYVHIESKARSLVQEQDLEDRAHHVLKHKNYSKAIAEFRESLSQLVLLFNHSVREQLEHRAVEGLPFPELLDTHQKLAESSQVLGLKQLFNCLYHLQEISKNLENLNDQCLETRYAIHVLRIGSHVNDAIQLVQGLAEAPYISLLAGDILEKLKDSFQMLAMVRENYIPTVPVGEVDLAADHSAVLFYALKVLHVLPEHIVAMRKDQPLDPDRIKHLHQRTAEVTTDIERIISNSSSYFKLFIEVPTMYQLFRELKSQLIVLSTASHHAVKDHLAGINDHLLTKILLEGDRWEENLGLIPGSLTGTMKTILDTFYQGLLEPLGLESKQHIELASSLLPIEQRLAVATTLVKQAQNEQKRVKEKQATLHHLSEQIKFFHTFKSNDADLLSTTSALLFSRFKSALPILQEVKRVLGADGPSKQNPLSLTLDSLLNRSAELDPGLINIEALVETGQHYFQGKLASHQLTMRAAEEKIDYLNELKLKQLDLNNNFVDTYAADSFEKEAKLLVARPLGLTHSSEEYRNKLVEHMNLAKDRIIAEAKNTVDIDKEIGILLRENVKLFATENDNHAKYEHLDKIMAVVLRVKQYVDQS